MPRRTFFSFHYLPDVWRAWNVRNSWVVKPENEIDRGFFDNSVFEAKQRESDDALKVFLREGVENTSVTCVLAGNETWSRRWVRYEIARSVLKGNGVMNRCASVVSTTCTSCSALVRRLAISTALCAAIEPVTPRTMFFPMLISAR